MTRKQISSSLTSLKFSIRLPLLLNFLGDVTPSTLVTQPTAPPPTAAGKGTEAVRIMVWII